MLVEDDNNLREIYGARLSAEGHEIVSAKDGEEALALAVKEKPDLIISDVMMPRISGFDMLDILRNAPDTKDTKVIMMTALSQAEDKARADKLGADLYLVKSQVTLEDVAKAVDKVLSSTDESSETTPSQDSPTSASPTDSTPEPAPPTPAPEPIAPQPANPNVSNTEPTQEPTQPQPVATTAPAPAAPSPVQPPVEEPSPTTPTTTTTTQESPVQPTEPVQQPQVVTPPTSTTSKRIEVTGGEDVEAPAEVAPPILDEADTPKAESSTNPEVVESAQTGSEPKAEQDSSSATPNTPPLEVVLPNTPEDNPVAVASAGPTSPSSLSAQSPTSSSNTPKDDGLESVGPNLAQALADEEQAVKDQIENFETTPTPTPKSTEGNNTQQADSDTPAVPGSSGTGADPLKTETAPEIQPDSNISPSQIAGQPKNESGSSVTPENPLGDTTRHKVIEPISDPSDAPDLNELLAKEEAKEAAQNINPETEPNEPSVIAPDSPEVQTADANSLDNQEDQGQNKPPGEPPTPGDEFSKIAL